MEALWEILWEILTHLEVLLGQVQTKFSTHMQVKITLERVTATWSLHPITRREVTVQRLCHQILQLLRTWSSRPNLVKSRESSQASALTQSPLQWTWMPLALVSNLVRVNVNPKWVLMNSYSSTTARKQCPRISSMSSTSEDTGTPLRKRQPPRLMTSTLQVAKSQWLVTVTSCQLVSRVKWWTSHQNLSRVWCLVVRIVSTSHCPRIVATSHCISLCLHSKHSQITINHNLLQIMTLKCLLVLAKALIRWTL